MFRDFFFVEKIRNRNLHMGSFFRVFLIGVPHWAIIYQQGNEKNKTATIAVLTVTVYRCT